MPVSKSRLTFLILLLLLQLAAMSCVSSHWIRIGFVLLRRQDRQDSGVAIQQAGKGSIYSIED